MKQMFNVHKYQLSEFTVADAMQTEVVAAAATFFFHSEKQAPSHLLAAWNVRCVVLISHLSPVQSHPSNRTCMTKADAEFCHPCGSRHQPTWPSSLHSQDSFSVTVLEGVREEEEEGKAGSVEVFWLSVYFAGGTITQGQCQARHHVWDQSLCWLCKLWRR